MALQLDQHRSDKLLPTCDAERCLGLAALRSGKGMAAAQARDGHGHAEPADSAQRGARFRRFPVLPPRMNRLRRRVPEGAHSQPRRDRDPRRPHAEGDGHRLGRRLLGDRPRRAARARGRRGLPDRPRGPGRELPEHRQDHRRRPRRRVPKRSTPATASSPRTPTSPAPAPRRGSSSSARRRRRSKRWARRPRRARSWRGRGADRARRDRARHDVEAARKQAEEAGYPVACKAAGGGGGKGFRVAMTPTTSRRPSRARPAKARSSSPTTASTSSATSRTRATSRSRCLPTGTAT